jgi:glutamine amidotransferase
MIRPLVATRRGGPLHYALLEGIVPCAVHGLDLRSPESDPQVRPHRRAKAVAFSSRLTTPNGFIEVPDGSVVAVTRSLQVSVGPI